MRDHRDAYKIVVNRSSCDVHDAFTGMLKMCTYIWYYDVLKKRHFRGKSLESIQSSKIVGRDVKNKQVVWYSSRGVFDHNKRQSNGLFIE